MSKNQDEMWKNLTEMRRNAFSMEDKPPIKLPEDDGNCDIFFPLIPAAVLLAAFMAFALYRILVG